MKRLNASAFLKAKDQIFDVRSPAEYLHGHLPEAVNLPLFTNEERAEIGTLYKQKGKDTAVLRGLEMVGPKMAGFVKTVRELAGDSKWIRLYCWRGGMRSGSMGWLLEQAGFEVQLLEGGYKNYRKLVLDELAEPANYVVLSGPTGSSKTETLHALKALGEQVIDLEGLANHRGSSYGSIALGDQPSTEQFENLLHLELSSLNRNHRIWLEDESKSIGKCYLPLEFWSLKQLAPILAIQPAYEARKAFLLNTYGNLPKADLAEATLRLEKRLGGDAVKKALQALEENRLPDLLDIVLHYYDKTYRFGAEKRAAQVAVKLETGFSNPEQMAQLLLQALKTPLHV